LGESLGRRLFPSEDPIRRAVSFGPGEPWYTVVGIAADVKNSGVGEKASPEYYLVRGHGKDPLYPIQLAPFGWRSATVVIRTTLSSQAAANALRAAVSALDSTVPLDVKTMRERVGSLAGRPRFNAALLALFAMIGLLL